MPFEKGKSGNPKGNLGKKLGLLKEQLLPLVPIALKVYEDLVNSDDDEIRLKAADRVLDRVYGKAPQAVELSGPEGGAITIIVNGKNLGGPSV